MNDYEVGYKKPPINRQYKKGDRANPNGRRGKKIDGFAAGEALARLRAEKIEVTVGGKTERLWRDEYQVRQLVQRARNGDLNAAEMLIDLHALSESGGDYTGEPKVITESEAKIQRLLKKMMP